MLTIYDQKSVCLFTMAHRSAGVARALLAAPLTHSPRRRQTTCASSNSSTARTTTNRSGSTSSSRSRNDHHFQEPLAGTQQIACHFLTTPHTHILSAMPKHAPSHPSLTHAQAACTHSHDTLAAYTMWALCMCEPCDFFAGARDLSHTAAWRDTASGRENLREE